MDQWPKHNIENYTIIRTKLRSKLYDLESDTKAQATKAKKKDKLDFMKKF
jgi:hypothetical protein